MKRVIISSLYSPYVRGGAEQVAASHATGYQQADDEVTVMALQPWTGWRSLWPTHAAQNGVVIYRWFALNLFSYITIDRHPLWQRLVWHAIDLVNPHSYLVLRRLLKQLRPDEVEVHIAKGLGYSIFAAIRASGIPWRLVLHDVQYVVPSGRLLVGQEGILRAWWCRLYAALCRALIGSPTEVLSPSRWLMDFYTQRKFFKRSRPTVELAFGQLPPVKPLTLTPPGDPAQLLFVGQIEAHKGIEWLIHALKSYELRITNYKLGEKFHLDIVGSGSRLAAVRQLVAGDERFTIWGPVAAEQLTEFFQRTDFTLVPSRCYENAPTIIVASLRHGVPVIAVAIGGIPEMIAVGINGWLMTPKTS